MGAVFGDATNVLKKLFADDVPKNLAERARVFYTKVNKVADFAGDNAMQIPLQVANPANAGPNPAKAYTKAYTGNTMANAYKAFTLTRFQAFHSVRLNREAIMAAKGKGKGSFVDLLESATSSMLDELGALTSRWLYGAGDAAIGARSGALSGEVVTLTIPTDAKNFFAGLQLEVYNGVGPSLRTITTGSGYLGTSITVASVDEENGKFTLTTGDAAAVGSFTAGDVFIPDGGSGGSGAFPGLAGWIPLTTPSATTFFGVNRSLDATRLSGVRLDNSTGQIEDNIMTVTERIFNVSGNKMPDICLMNPVNFTTLSKSLDSKRTYTEPNGSSASAGFETIKILTSGGAVQVYADPDCPTNRGYVLTKDTWKIHHMGGIPHLVEDGNGNLMEPVDGTDSVMIKACAYLALACDAPGRNGVFSI